MLLAGNSVTSLNLFSIRLWARFGLTLEVGLFVSGDPINGAENQNSGELEWFSMMKFTKVVRSL